MLLTGNEKEGEREAGGVVFIYACLWGVLYGREQSQAGFMGCSISPLRITVVFRTVDLLASEGALVLVCVMGILMRDGGIRCAYCLCG